MNELADSPDFEQDFDLGDKVVFNCGDLVGEVGSIEGLYLTEGQTVYLVYVEDRQTLFKATSSMLDLTFDPPAVPAHGMTSQQLSDEVLNWVGYCQSRFTGVGDEQYSTETHQKFEAMHLSELIEYALEELADQVNYATMLGIRFRRIQAALGQYL
jgi:hypothetical protein